MTAADRYTYCVHWSAQDAQYVGTVVELPSVSWLAPNRPEALAGIQRVTDQIVAEMHASGEEPPPATNSPEAADVAAIIEWEASLPPADQAVLAALEAADREDFDPGS